MKLNEVTQKLEYFDPANLDVHYPRHVIDSGVADASDPNDPVYEFTTYEFPTKQDYNEAADKFAKSDIRDPDIEGFYGLDGRYYKRNVLTNEFTIYSIRNRKPVNITYYPITDSKWNSTKNRLYNRDITYKEDVK